MELGERAILTIAVNCTVCAPTLVNINAESTFSGLAGPVEAVQSVVILCHQQLQLGCFMEKAALSERMS